MIWAEKDGEKIKATPKDYALCPISKNEVISKCGLIKVWHWAHKIKEDCDSFYEPETIWHYNWKQEFPKENQEVTIGVHRADIKTNGGCVIELQNSPLSTEKIQEREEFYKNMIWVLNGGTLCSKLDLRIKDEIITFRWKNPPKSWWSAKKIIYIDLDGIVSNLKYNLNLYIKKRKVHRTPIYEEVYYEYYDEYGEYHVVNYPKIEGYVDNTDKEIKQLKSKIDLFDNKLFLIKKIYKKLPCGGWGYLMPKEEFLRIFKKER